MDNLPAPTPNRQWFRLASLARLEALGQTPDPNPLSSTSATPAPAAPQPPIPAPIPTPINPRPQPSEPPQSQPSTTKNAKDMQTRIPPPPPTQLLSKPPPQTIRVPSRSPTPPQSPKIIKAPTPNPSETLRVLPQQLQPHPEPEPELKMPELPKLSSNSSNGINTTGSSTNGKEDTASSWHKKNKSAENNENRKKVITMAGENTGAYFELVPTRRGNNMTKGEQLKGMVSEDLSSREGVKKEEAKPKRSVVNSNVQSVNNSILFGTSCTLQSPGVHIALVSRRQPKHKGSAESKSGLEN